MNTPSAAPAVRTSDKAWQMRKHNIHAVDEVGVVVN